ncbi:hypothetical protein E3N88_43037 [Mikania micrantha]|uniref:Uncharacterized protein n=1 Tax=Mikania micrantha TaxID=192012 RepID=A0A5N6LGW7_9ASTR|nr:hypothetical protein E3N88_43037 [Mikania micrantha]
MESLSPAITSKLLFPPKNTSSHATIRSCFRFPVHRATVIQLFKRNPCVASAAVNSMSAMGFSDPYWKSKTPVSEEFAQGYPSDEEWHGYVNNNDRVLLKLLHGHLGVIVYG